MAPNPGADRVQGRLAPTMRHRHERTGPWPYVGRHVMRLFGAAVMPQDDHDAEQGKRERDE